MEQTFTRSITYKKNSFDGKDFKLEPTKVEVKFKELNEQDRDQHSLHFQIVDLFTSPVHKASGKVTFQRESVYDLTTTYIKTMMVKPESFVNETEFDNFKNELLNSFNVIYALGLWLITNKWFPFFQESTEGIGQ